MVLDAATGAILAKLPQFSLANFAFDRSGQVMLVTADSNHDRPAQAELRRVRGGGLVRSLPGVGRHAVVAALSPDGHLAAVANFQGQVGVFNVATGKALPLSGQLPAASGAGTTIALKFSPDGSLLLIGDPEAHELVVWNLHTGRVVSRIAEPGQTVINGAISPNDRLLVTVSDPSSVADLYQVGDAHPIRTFLGSAAGMFDADFSADGTLIATTSPVSEQYDGDNTVRVWSTTLSQPLLTLSEGAGSRIAFSADGHSLITNGGSPDVSVPCVVCGGFGYLLAQAKLRERRQLTPSERAQYLGH